MGTIRKKKSQTELREQGENTLQCKCPGTMSDWEEERDGNFMKIAHSAIITKLIKCLEEWKKVREQRSREQATQEERRLEGLVGEQLRELEGFEAENKNKHCDVNIWMILVKYGWIWA